MAEGIQHAYAKTPLLKGNRYSLSLLTDVHADRYMLWLDAYGSQDAKKVVGRNPWTLWQYTWMVDVPGIGTPVPGNVFFGEPEAYTAFKRGAGNIALIAVQ